MKKIFIFILAFLMSFNTICSLPVFANTINDGTTTEYTFYDDGSYMVTRITEEPNAITTRSSSTTTKSKISSYYSSNNVELWFYVGSRIEKTINKSVTLTCSAKGTFS